MRNRSPYAGSANLRQRSSYATLLRKSLKKATRLTLGAALLAQGLWLGAQPAVYAQKRAASVSSAAPATVQRGGSITPAPAQEDATQNLQSQRVRPVATAVVNMEELSRQQAMNPVPSGPMIPRAIHPPMTIDDTPGETKPDGGGDEIGGPGGMPMDDIPGPSVPSPAPSQNFEGEFDEAVGGGPSGTFNIPPDTMGAVGLTKVVSYLNNNYVVHDKATGARLSVVGHTAFWAATGASGAFDPRIQYDPYNNRWVISAVSNAQTANSSVLIGVSNTPDPQGTYTLFRFIVGCAPGAPGCNANGEWADFPMLGFNKNWVAVSWNQFTFPGVFVTGKILVLDYPAMRAGTATATLFNGAPFCFHPATTFSPTDNNLYYVAHLSSGGATYVVGTTTGTPASPAIGLSPTRTRPGGGWTQPGGDVAPQTCTVAPCPGTLRRIDSGDAFVRSNVVFRNGSLWYPQTIALPTGGLTLNSRLVAQWTQLTTTGGNTADPNFGTVVQGGRVEDPTATLTNGGNHYFYPSISVNKHNDALLGFSEAESDDFVDAGYTFRFRSDAPGTMRDPLIYKEGEDYYEKTFGGTRNRWGDYSHTVVDPINDNDLWTIQEFADSRVPPGCTPNTGVCSRWSTWWAKVSVPAGAGDLLISEFRLFGPAGPGLAEPNNDEFIEIYNPSGGSHVVNTGDGSTGYAIAASDGVVRCTIPNGTPIPARGHYLCVNNGTGGYSLTGYAASDNTYTTNILANAGIAIFNTALPANFATGTRLDAVGSTTEGNTLYKEGTGYPAITAFNMEHAFVRDNCGKGGSTAALGACPAGGLPKDTDDNAADFYFTDVQATSAGAGTRLGAPGPENLASPIQRNANFGAFALDSTVGTANPPNRVRDFTSDPANNSSQGTLEIRRRYVNNTGVPVTRLRFRIIDITTFQVPSGFADMRARTSGPVVVSGINDAATCSAPQVPPSSSPTPPCTVTVQGTTLETPPLQPNGGGFNSSLSAGVIALATPLAPGQSINVRFLLGLQQTGTFKFFINIEALP